MQLKDFNYYLQKTGEVGHADKVVHSIVYVSGLPKAHLNELVIFESGEIGQVMGLTRKYVEILRLTPGSILIDERCVRTGDPFRLVVCDDLLGKTVDSLGRKEGKTVTATLCEERLVDQNPQGMQGRMNINKSFQTGVSIVDLIVPLGKGQRELLIGDRKTGKTQFLLQSLLTQARQGSVCIYAAIAKKNVDIKSIEDFVIKNNVQGSTVIVASTASDPSGLIFLTPYTAMTIAEFFRDIGYNVYIIFDDLTAHAQHYREISLMAKRFPGRNSYPGDIFYIHSKLLERAGNFMRQIKNEKGKVVQMEVSITAIPVAELVLGDLSGYIQTNLMAMTDGHIFFDADMYNEGIRPPINPFLSVTRVGRQAQTPLLRDINRQITSFLVYIEKLREFLHFGAELSESTQRTLSLGNRIRDFFNQPWTVTVPEAVNILVIGALWGGSWKDVVGSAMKRDIQVITDTYLKDNEYKTKIDSLINRSQYLADLVSEIKKEPAYIKPISK